MDNSDWIKQLLLMGIGTTSMVAEKIKEVSDELVKDGKINSDQAKNFVDDLMTQMKSEQGSFENNLERYIRNILQDLGVPRQSEMDELRGRIDRLERQVRDLENKLWRYGTMKSMREILLSFAIIAVCGLFLIVASLFGGGEKINAIAAEIEPPAITQTINKEIISMDLDQAVTTDSGLKYIDIVEGTGESPQKGQKVTVHYTGTLTYGKKFDSSKDRNQPFTFTIGVGQVIKGWDEGVASMKVGGQRTLIIPPELGYGARGAGGVIPPNATLLFDVELLEVK